MSDINVIVNDEIVNIDVIDTPVLVNVVNSPGVPGAPGQGIPVGGTTGQVLAKNSATNYDTAWVNVTGGAWGTITGTLSNQTDLQNALNAKVPYTGATTNVNLGEYEIKAGQVTLDTSPTGTAAVGTTRWNDTIGSSETTLKGGSVILKNGVDLVARIVNKVSPNTTLTKAAYQAVRVSGAQGQRLAVAFAQANNDANSADTIGLVTETIATNQEGFIITVGQLEGINTTGSLQGETWVDGDVLYLSPTTAGAITKVKPTGNGHIVVIGYVEYAHANNGKIYVKVMNGWELDELHDVSIVTPLNNEALIYESSSALWKNKSIATALGYTPEQPLTFNSPLSRSVNAVSIPQATGSVNGFLSSTDWTTFNNKQNALGYTPANAATTLTINGVTYDLSANRTFTVGSVTGSGASGQVAYWTGTSVQSGSNNLFWDAAQGRLGIGTNVPAYKFHNVGSAGFDNGGSGDVITIINDGFLKWSSVRLRGFGSGFLFQDNAFNIKVSLSMSGSASVFNTGGNYLFGGGTDTGERLQVTGNVKIVGSGNTSGTTALTVQNSSSVNILRVLNDGQTILRGTTNNDTTNIFRIEQQNGNGRFLVNANGQTIIAGDAFTSSETFVTVSRGNFNPTSGTATHTSLAITPTINQTGGANGITRGLYVNPTLTAAADFRAIETTNGKVIFGNLPTSSAGLPTGAIWNDAGTIKIV
jgi:nitrogen fixation protein